MAPFLDARLPLIFGPAADAGPADAVLIEGEGESGRGRDWFQPDPASAHPADCACCTPRSGAGMALARLILARGRGTGLFFNRVIVEVRTPAGRAAVLAALEHDPIVSCFCKLG
jgi:hypothetical protein